MLKTKGKNKDKRIKELENEIERLHELVINDELTGALNRKGIIDKLEIIFKEALYLKENPELKRSFYVDNLSIVFIDLDDFKKINDKYGHAAGDDVLKEFSLLMKESVREMDLVGRLGGEEFIIALLGATENDAYRKAEEIREKIKEKIFKPSRTKKLKVTISVGVASIQKTDSNGVSDLIASADQAMYEAKTNRGKNNTVRFSEI